AGGEEVGMRAGYHARARAPSGVATLVGPGSGHKAVLRIGESAKSCSVSKCPAIPPTVAALAACAPRRAPGAPEEDFVLESRLSRQDGAGGAGPRSPPGRGHGICIHRSPCA